MRLWFGLFVLIVGQFLHASDTGKQQEEITRLEQAVSRTNIFELPSFVMRADVQIEVRGDLVNGTYELMWNGPNQWRGKVSVPGYTEVQIGGKGTIWVQRSVDFIPVPIYRMYEALGFGSTAGSPHSTSLVQLDLKPTDTIKKARKLEDHGDELTCFEIQNAPEICVNDRSNTIVRTPPDKFTDNDFQPVGVKMFPRFLTVRYGGEIVAKVNVRELASPAQFPPDAFTPPAGVSSEAGCMNPSLPRQVKKQKPEYPATARQQHRQGTVSFDVLIGKDGIPQFRRLIESAGKDLDDSSKRAISLWRYDPAMCDGQPVQMETVLEVNYVLSY